MKVRSLYRSIWLYIYFSFVIFIFSFLFAQTSVFALDWELEKVSDNDGGWPSLALDSNNLPHISSASSPGNAEDLVYHYFNGTEWKRTVVDNGASVGLESYIALDSNENPHISYYAWSGGDLKYAYFDGQQWRIETLINKLNLGGENRVLYPFTRIAIDSNNNPHITYLNYYLYKQTGGSWNIQQVENLSDSSSLVLDSYDRPHILSYNYYIWFNGTGWYSEEFASSANDDSSMVLDNSGSPHIVYYDEEQERLFYTFRLNGTWYPEEIPNTRWARFPSLVLDNTDQPHISFYNPGTEELTYVFKQNNQWQFEVINSVEYKSWYSYDVTSSIKLDSYGNPYIVYHGEDNELWYARRTTTNHRPRIDVPNFIYAEVDKDFELLISATDLDIDNIVTLNIENIPDWIEIVNSTSGNPAQLTLGGIPTINYASTSTTVTITAYDDNSPEVVISKELDIFVSLDWTAEIVDFTGDAANCAIAIDSQNKPHLSYNDSMNDLKYAYFDGSLWNIQVIDSGGSVGEYSSIAVDSQNHPHISYYDDTNDDLKYAYFDGTAWQIKTVDSAGNVGSFSSIAVDSQNHLHISYYSYTNDDLKYAYFDGISWRIETVDSEGYVGKYTSIAVDSQSLPHMSYFDETNHDLKYAYFDGENWQTETIDSKGDVGSYSAIALDTNNFPYIAYRENENGDLKYAYFDGENWKIEVAYSEGYSSYRSYSSLKLDGNNNPHITFYYADGIYHIIKSNSVWSVENIYQGNKYYLSYPAIALDNNNIPQIIFYEKYDLIYIYRNSSNYPPVISSIYDQWVASGQEREWTITAKDPNPEDIVSLTVEEALPDWLEITRQTSGNPAQITLKASPLAEDVGGVFSITFLASDNGIPIHTSTQDLEVTVIYDWSIEIVDKGYEELGSYVSLGIDKNEKFHISYWDRDRNDLKYAYFDGQNWHIETVDTEGSVGSFSSIAVDFQNHPHISYFDETNYDLKYTYFDGATWQIETVDSGYGGRYISIAVDSQNHPHISYYGGNLGNLKYAYFDGTEWEIETVDSTGNAGKYSSIAVDSQSYPHISYYDDTNDDLKYAYFDGQNWQIKTVDGGAYVFGYTSIAIDSQSHPQIIYYDMNSFNQKYAYFNGQSWGIETVFYTQYYGYKNSIVIDKYDSPHLSCRGDNSGVYYAYKQNSEWEIRKVDSEYSTGFYTSIALDGYGTPYIVYSSRDNELRFAYSIPNSPPIIESFGPQDTTPTINEGESLEFSVIASDSNGDTLSYSWTLDDVEISNTNTFIYAPTFEDIGNHNITVVVSDPGDLIVSQNWEVEVVNTNHPPVLSLPYEGQMVVAKVGEKTSFTVRASDKDKDDQLTITADNLPQGAQFKQIKLSRLRNPNLNINKVPVPINDVEINLFNDDRTAYSFSWTPDETQVSEQYPDDLYTVTFTAGDGKEQDSGVVYFWVNE